VNAREDTKDAVLLRELRAGDYDAVVALWLEAGLPYKPRGRDSREALAVQLGQATAIYLVAEAGGEIIGTVLGSHDGRKGWINRLAVAPAYRHRGVAATLVAELERRLDKLGIEIVAGLVEEGNDTSHAFFAAAGYKPFPGITYFTKRKHEDV